MSNELMLLLPLNGNGHVALADSTPGIARSRGMSWSKNAMMFSGFG